MDNYNCSRRQFKSCRNFKICDGIIVLSYNVYCRCTITSKHRTKIHKPIHCCNYFGIRIHIWNFNSCTYRNRIIDSFLSNRICFYFRSDFGQRNKTFVFEKEHNNCRINSTFFVPIKKQIANYSYLSLFWRRKWDSNPRGK